MENLAGALQIGRESAGWSQYDGGLDELRLWSVARTASELQATQTIELTGSELGLRAYWRFNEGSGTTVADTTPGNRPATLFNCPVWTAAGAPVP